MNPNLVSANLQKLPKTLRQTLYWIVLGIGAVITALEIADVSDLGPFTLEEAQQFYTALAAVTGVVAVGNVNRPPTDQPAFAMGAYVEDVDMSAFEPVGEIDDVYAEDLP
jgi:hypothetical protein